MKNNNKFFDFLSQDESVRNAQIAVGSVLFVGSSLIGVGLIIYGCTHQENRAAWLVGFPMVSGAVFVFPSVLRPPENQRSLLKEVTMAYVAGSLSAFMLGASALSGGNRKEIKDPENKIMMPRRAANGHGFAVEIRKRQLREYRALNTRQP